MSYQFDGASEMLFQPFGGYFRIGMIIQRFVDARYGFYILQHSAYVMAYQDDGPFLVDFFQQGVEFGLKPFVNVGIGFVQNDNLRV